MEEKIPMRVLFLDVDGVLNCQIFYEERYRRRKRTVGFWWRKIFYKIKWLLNGCQHKATSLAYSPAKQKKLDEQYKKFIFRFERFKEETCVKRLKWLNGFCGEMNCKIVVSSVWKRFFTIEEWNAVFVKMGLQNIKVIGITPDRCTLRGTEIQHWLDKNPVDDFIIVDDDSDMLPGQMHRFFLTDNYSGLTPTTLYKMKRYFNRQINNMLMPDGLRESLMDLLLFCETDGTVTNGFRTKEIILSIRNIYHQP